jgi:hypothetical protein
LQKEQIEGEKQMTIQERKKNFETNMKVYESKRLEFIGVDGYDVYNCSIPFIWNGKEYIYGRVEKRDEWARSWVRLFEKAGEDRYKLKQNSMIYQLEDPYISFINGEIVLGGTHPQKIANEISRYFGYFYRGTDLEDLKYFTTGPDNMKDIRLVDMRNGKIGIFSRPRGKKILEKYGSESMIGFTQVNSLDEITDKVIENAEPILGIFDKGEWGGCNHIYMLENGKIGIIGHQSFTQYSDRTTVNKDTEQVDLSVYVNIAFEFDPATFNVTNSKIIGTRKCYPDYPAKRPNLVDCTFTSGMTVRTDGKINLYAGIGDTAEGRIVVDYPFSAKIL